MILEPFHYCVRGRCRKCPDAENDKLRLPQFTCPQLGVSTTFASFDTRDRCFTQCRSGLGENIIVLLWSIYSFVDQFLDDADAWSIAEPQGVSRQLLCRFSIYFLAANNYFQDFPERRLQLPRPYPLLPKNRKMYFLLKITSQNWLHRLPFKLHRSPQLLIPPVFREVPLL